MSAFIVSKAHIDAMVSAGLTYSSYGPLKWANDQGIHDGSRKLDHTTADQVGRMLWAENVASVDHRYSPAGREVYYGKGWENGPEFSLPGTFTRETIPGTAETIDVPEYAYLDEYRHERAGRVPTPVETLSILACYEYQSCEHDGWAESEAKRFCEALQGAAIRALPGYDDAPWEWPGKPTPAAPVIALVPDPTPEPPALTAGQAGAAALLGIPEDRAAEIVQEVSAKVEAENAPDPTARNDAIKLIRAALKRRSGKAWSVKGDRGTAWGWIHIASPPRRMDGYQMTEADRVELGELLGLGRPAHHQGESVAASSNHRLEYVARAEGRTPETFGEQYWD